MIVLFFIMATALSVSAQHRYYLATKGERIEYDTAVVVHISAYKKDLEILKEKDEIIDSLSNLNNKYEQKIQETIMATQKQEEEKEMLIQNLQELKDNPPQQEKKNKWYLNPLFGVGIGMLIGVYSIN